MNDLTGKTIAKHYHVDSILGRGGMGDVYKALKSILPKAVPFLRAIGIIGISIVLLWVGSWGVPKLISLVPTAKTSAIVTITPSPIPPTKTPIPTPTKTKEPTATPLPSTFSTYDNFSSVSSSKKFDTALWNDPVGEGTINWQNGYLVFSGVNGGRELGAKNPAQWHIAQIGKLQADLRIDNVSGGYAFAKIQISTTLFNGNGTWWAQCRVGSSDGKNAKIICDSYRWYDSPVVKYHTEAYPIDFGKFYTVAIEIAPDTSYVRYYVNGEEIGSYQPEERSLLTKADFDWRIGLWMSSGVTATGAVDNVMVGTSK